MCTKWNKVKVPNSKVIYIKNTYATVKIQHLKWRFKFREDETYPPLNDQIKKKEKAESVQINKQTKRVRLRGKEKERKVKFASAKNK